MEHLELTRCESITEFGVHTIIGVLPSLQFLDLNFIPAITPKELEEVRKIKPQMLIRRYLQQVVDPKDNGLRVPRRIVG